MMNTITLLVDVMILTLLIDMRIKRDQLYLDS